MTTFSKITEENRDAAKVALADLEAEDIDIQYDKVYHVAMTHKYIIDFDTFAIYWDALSHRWAIYVYDSYALDFETSGFGVTLLAEAYNSVLLRETIKATMNAWYKEKMERDFTKSVEKVLYSNGFVQSWKEV